MVGKKTERVTIRFPEKDYEFLKDIANDLDVPLAQLIRRICIRFWMKYVTGEVKKTFSEVREDFLTKVYDYIDEYEEGNGEDLTEKDKEE